MNKKVWCFFGVHEHKVLDTGPYSLKTSFKTVQGSWYNLQCEVCGNLKYKILCK